MSDEAIFESGLGITDAGAPGADGGRRNTALIERRQPRYAGAIDADVRIIVDGSEHGPFDRGFRAAAEQRAVRAGYDDRSLVTRFDEGTGIHHDDIGAGDPARPVAPLMDSGGRTKRLARRGRHRLESHARQHSLADPDATSGFIGKRDEAAAQAVRSISDASRMGRDRRRRDKVLIEKTKTRNPCPLATDAGVAQDDAAEPRLSATPAV